MVFKKTLTSGGCTYRKTIIDPLGWLSLVNPSASLLKEDLMTYYARTVMAGMGEKTTDYGRTPLWEIRASGLQDYNGMPSIIFSTDRYLTDKDI
ncbi:hypothetical protein VNO77_08237 [Canavalia gladiata]|uniref:Uncharacterized protein n=1 Tax=Canavalia gladiata TaxID=3824 RepID=A0AAN9M9Y1_CANGL